ncbi:glucosidase YgjK precursor [bacterium BMS3Bbin04]|nr:glucosidase YgjK precursor [bacterium BMS3Bbin04]
MQAIAFLEHDPRSLISLDSPLHGSTWKPWVERGYYALELGVLEWSDCIYSAVTGWSDHDSNDVRVIVSAPDEDLAAQLEMTRAVPLTPRSERHDLTLTNALPSAPKNLTVRADTFGLHLEWDGDSRQMFRVYWTHLKCRLTEQERTSRDRWKDSHLIAGARSAQQFKYLGQTDKTSFSLDLRPRVTAPDGSGRIKVAYDPANDQFIRRFLVTTTTADKYPGPASETVVYSPVPTIEQQLSTENATLDPEALLATGTTLQRTITLAPGQSDTVRIVRQVAADKFEFTRNKALLANLQGRSLDHLAEPHRKRFDSLPPLEAIERESELLFRSALNMVYQSMLPAEGQLTHPYYVFSREPTWGWGHGGQVFHESLSMTTLVHLDPALAMESQRAYLDVQHENGYIPYRSGPYLSETIPANGELTTSAPWYAWTNWQIYLVTHDRAFLKEMYESSASFYDYIIRNRDKDKDGLAEWGGDGVLESVRDASSVIWDEVAKPSELECLDLNCLLVNEAKALAEMAFELGLSEDGENYSLQANERAELIEETFWDEETGFFYHVDADDHDFSISHPNDLKRKEIIGFLPLWVGIGSNEQVERVINEHLLNPDSFWREYGVPSLAADDASYDPRGYWNGPVWIQWNELIFQILMDNERQEEAFALIQKLEAGMIATLAKDHKLWEFYSPDSAWGGWHSNYIWASTMAGIMLRAYMLTE